MERKMNRTNVCDVQCNRKITYRELIMRNRLEFVMGDVLVIVLYSKIIFYAQYCVY